MRRFMILGLIFLLNTAVAYCSPGISAAPAIVEEDAFKQVVSSLRSGAYSEVEMNAAMVLIDEYNGRYTDGTYVDDLLMLKGVLLNRQNKYQESNLIFARLLKDHPYPVIEKATILGFKILPAVWLQLDVLTYIYSVRADNFKALNDSVQAAVCYEFLINHLRKEAAFTSAYKDKYFEFYSNIVDIYLKEKNVIKAKKFAREYIKDDTNHDIAGKEKMTTMLSAIQANFISKRDPFSRPSFADILPVIPSANPVLLDASGNIRVIVPFVSKVYVTGIFIDNDRTVILQYSDKSYIKREGEYFRGFRLGKINKSSVIFTNGIRTVVINIGEGRSL